MKKMLIIKTIVFVVGISILAAVALSSCSVGRGMTNCDAARFKMSGYR